MRKPEHRGKIAVVAAALLMMAGLAIDLGMNRPRASELRRLSAQRSQLLVQAAQKTEQQAELELLARHVGRKDAKETSTSRPVDPITFLGREIDRANLKQLELSSEASVEVGSLIRNRMFLRAEGSYGRLVSLMRSLEMSRRFVTIDAFSIEQGSAAGVLEGRMNVSVYDSKGTP